MRIRAFRAVDDPEACEKFIYGHRKILEIYYGIIKITSDSNDWLKDPYTIVIIAEDPETGKIYGGAKVQVFDGSAPLPIQSAVSKYDPLIDTVVWNDFKKGGTCEICGLWNSKEIAGLGIGSHILSRVGIAISDQLGVKSIFVLCAPATVRMGKRNGFVVETELGKDGLFFYPKDDFIATVMRLRDVHDFSLANPQELESILLLRNSKTVRLAEKGPKGAFEVDYELEVHNWVPPKYEDK
ncbi:hypothetical protein NIASO_00045 [Niabella soli DSM 19437]|uniref:N-acetyltransferase domain-containing protein n=1 Tax=Niabella soli DSM 19437 TaxID=929713 RepID=W0EXU2_9BACT|nr:hypothetical protein NIASO_00045 [Niabella soli DSM 19437]